MSIPRFSKMTENDIEKHTKQELTEEESTDIKKWIIYYSSKNYWRVSHYLDLQDLLQEGMIEILKCKEEYGVDMDYPNFKALVITAFTNRITQLSYNKTEDVSTYYVPLHEIDISKYYDSLKSDYCDPYFSVKISNAPDIIKKFLSLFYDKKSLNKMRDRPLTNKFICELLETDHTKINLIDYIKQYFSTS